MHERVPGRSPEYSVRREPAAARDAAGVVVMGIALSVIMPPLLWLHTAEWAWWEVLPWFERR